MGDLCWTGLGAAQAAALPSQGWDGEFLALGTSE